MLDPRLWRRIIATKPTTLIGAEPASRASLLRAADVRRGSMLSKKGLEEPIEQ
jgi:hypothetical protein